MNRPGRPPADGIAAKSNAERQAEWRRRQKDLRAALATIQQILADTGRNETERLNRIAGVVENALLTKCEDA